jgi:hypothetical protein
MGLETKKDIMNQMHLSLVDVRLNPEKILLTVAIYLKFNFVWN